MKKLCIFILALTIGAGTLFAQSGTCGENLTWTLNDEGKLTISGTGAMTNWSGAEDDEPSWTPYRSSITWAELEDGVTGIGSRAFQHCNKMTAVTIPNSVTSIGDYAFYGCSALSFIDEFDSNFESFGLHVFAGCSSLTAIDMDAANPNYSSENGVLFNKAKTRLIQYPAGKEDVSYGIPATVTVVGSEAFLNARKLTNIVIPDGVQTIKNGAFLGCSGLLFVTIPKSVTTIEENAFVGCNKLTSFMVETTNTKYCSKEDVLFSKDKKKLIQYPAGNKNTSYLIPDGTAHVGNYAFNQCKDLTSIIIPKTVTNIGWNAFQSCSGLTPLTCRAVNPPHCDDDCFDDVTKTIPVYVPEESLDAYKADEGWSYFTNIKPITCNASSGTCGANGDNLTWSLSCDGVLTISGEGDMKQWTHVTTSHYAPWRSYEVESIVIEEGVTSIGMFAFWNCYHVQEITLPNSLKLIGASAFFGCTGLESVTFGSGIAAIGEYAFDGCTGLTSMEIPETVTTIGAGILANCSNIESITVASGNKNYDSRFDCNAIIEKANYKLMQGCKNTVIPNNVSRIWIGAFWGHTGLTAIEIPSTFMEVIEESAFRDCSGLTSIAIPKGVTTIKASTFRGCSNLKTVILRGEITEINDYAFSGCTSLKGFDIPATVKVIGRYAFEACSSLTAIHIPEGYTRSIERGTFNGCSALKSISMPNVTWIESSAFMWCTSLTSIELSADFAKIDGEAFYKCESLETVICKAATPPSCGEKAWTEVPIYKGYLYVPEESIETYKNTEPWSGFKYIEILPASSGTCGENVTWKFEDGVLTISGTGDMPDYGFTDPIPWSSFESSIKSVVIEEGVTHIGNYAFVWYTNLTSVTVPGTVTSIGIAAFAGCNGITTITFPESVATIGDYAFMGCTGLTSIQCERTTPPDCGESCFFEVETPSIKLTVPDEAVEAYQADETWGAFTVKGASECDPHVGYFNSFKNTWELSCDGVLTIGGNGDFTISGSWVDYPWYEYNKSVKSVVISEGITSIGRYAFYNYPALTTVTIPEGVTAIGDYAFAYCSAITDITCNAAEPPVCGKDVFKDVSREAALHVPAASAEVYGTTEPWNEFVLPTITGICGDNLTWELKNGVLTISGSGDMSWKGDAPWAQYAGAIKSVEMDDEVTSIGDRAFDGCVALTTVMIPENVTQIGEQAFSNCLGLRNIYCDALTPPACGNGCFSGINKKILVVYVPDASYHAYQTDKTWGAFSISPASECTTASGALANNKNISWRLSCTGMLIIEGTGVITAESSNMDITYTWAWDEYASSIKSVVIGEGITKIGAEAFANLDNLKALSLPNSLITIEHGAFHGCHKLASVSIPKNVIHIYDKAFSHCYGLTNIIFHGLTSIYDNVFVGCGGSLASITCFSVAPLYCTGLAYADSQIADRAPSIPLYVPDQSVKKYKAHSAWKKFKIKPLSERPGAYIIASGTIGDNITWKLDSNGILSIQGTGSLPGWAEPVPSSAGKRYVPAEDASAPWYPYLEDILYIEIGAGITGIGDYSFYGCTNVQSVTSYAATPPTCGTEAFGGIDTTIPLYVPDGTAEAYMAAGQWQDFDIQTSEVQTPTAIDQTINDPYGSGRLEEAPAATKVIRNGVMYILRDGKVYTVQGAEL
ncbi:MAG: leucine-rich repeat domain-containing protein [Paludibacteraceae bacterium]|nr:leucine-rich repeat domain-containing protein [Paludibacteraceae bacterium]